MGEAVRFGLIGAGNIAGFHAKAISLVDGAELVAMHSRRSDVGRAFCQEQNCDYESTLEGLLTREDVDAVAVTTPSGTHAEIGIAAARAGKHVLCEKPLDITVERIDSLVAACDNAKVLLGAIFQSRFGEGARYTKRAVEAGRFGQLTQCSAFIPWFRSDEYYASAAWRGTWALDGGGALMNQGIHAIDLLLWLAGDVTHVSAQCQTILRDIEVEDNAVAWLKFKNGGLGVIQGSTTCFPGEPKRIELKGSLGSVTLEDDMPSFWHFNDDHHDDEVAHRLVETASIAGGASDPKAISVDGHKAQYEDFTAAIQEGREPAIPGREGRRAVQVIRAIYESSQSGKTVELQELGA